MKEKKKKKKTHKIIAKEKFIVVTVWKPGWRRVRLIECID